MAAYGKAAAIIATVSVLGGVIACGVFLLLIAIIGLIGAIRHHQVILFFVSLMQEYCLFLLPIRIESKKQNIGSLADRLDTQTSVKIKYKFNMVL